MIKSFLDKEQKAPTLVCESFQLSMMARSAQVTVNEACQTLLTYESGRRDRGGLERV